MIPAYSLDLLGGYVFQVAQDENPDLLEMDEKQIDSFLNRKAIEFMKENPLRTLKLKLLNVVYLFHPRIVPFYPLAPNTKLIFTEAEGIRVENLPSRGGLAEWAHPLSYSFIFLTALCGFPWILF